MKISKEDFIQQCIEVDECTSEMFHDYFEVVPCNCEYEDCKGWQVISIEGAFKKMRDRVLNRNR